MNKAKSRKELESSVLMFLAGGGQITKYKTLGTKRKPKKEKIVEIEVEFLPEHLRNKHFGDE